MRARVYDPLDDSEKIESGAGQPVNAGNRHFVAAREVLKQLQQFAALGAGAARLLAIDFLASGLAKLFKLSVKRLAVGADAGVAESPAFRSVSVICFGRSNPLRLLGRKKCPKL